MRKTLIVGVILIALGAAVFFVGLNLAGGKVSEMSIDMEDFAIALSDDGKSTEKTFELDTDEIRSIDIDLANDSAVISPSPDGRIHITVFESPSWKYSVKTGKTLSIAQNGKFHLFKFAPPHTVTVLLPEDFSPSLDIDTASGSVSIESLELGSTKVSTASGDITVTEVFATNLDADTASGSIDVNNVISSDSTELETVSGKLSATEIITINALSAKTVSGTLDVDGVLVYKRIELESVSGSIKALLAGELSDYAVTTATVSGKSNLPSKTEGDVKLNVETVSGSIEVTFVGKSLLA